VSDIPPAEPSAAPITSALTESPPPVSIRRIVWPALAVGFGLLVGSFFATGELAAFLTSAWATVPVVGLCMAAYLGVERRWARWTAVSFLIVLVGVGALFSCLMLVIGYTGWLEDELDPNALIEAGVGALVVLTVVIVSAAALPLVRRRHPGRRAFVTRVAIMFVMPMVGVMFVPLVFLNEPPLLALMSEMVESGQDPNLGRGVAGLVLDSVYGLCWTLPAAVFAVGYGVRRTFSEVIDRLGLIIPTRATWLTALIATVAILAGVWLMDLAVTWLWSRLGWPVTDERMVDVLFAHSFGVAGALIVGVTAGLGEEVVVRGILQPRVGILLSNLAFTAVHAYQYHWDALVQVFVIGLVLGFVRRRTDTTTTALIHGAYDVVVLGFSALAQPA